MAFGLLVLMLVMQRRPRFSQFTSTVFGLFYCGYLPSFWLKLRMLNTPIGAPRRHQPSPRHGSLPAAKAHIRIRSA